VNDVLLDDHQAPRTDTAVQIEPAEFRKVLSHFASGVVVITGRNAEGEPEGMTAQSFTSLSLDPPLILVCPARRSTTWPRIAGRRFAVNVLGAEQHDVSRLFSRRGIDKFAEAVWHDGPYGLPLIDGAIAQLECDLESVHPGGDHHIAVGRVRTLAASLVEPSPLVFYRSQYWVTEPHPAER
jgi:3-hydroxy-9,10-secoandrosta-1,3,5(10)-triene-9,17-dione monooxygenase reductase component